MFGEERRMRWTAGVFALALAVIAWATWAETPDAVAIPVVFVKNDATGVDQIKAALLTGSDVIVREDANGASEKSTAEGPSTEELDGACISYGAVPPKKGAAQE